MPAGITCVEVIYRWFLVQSFLYYTEIFRKFKEKGLFLYLRAIGCDTTGNCKLQLNQKIFSIVHFSSFFKTKLLSSNKFAVLILQKDHFESNTEDTQNLKKELWNGRSNFFVPCNNSSINKNKRFVMAFFSQQILVGYL